MSQLARDGTISNNVFQNLSKTPIPNDIPSLLVRRRNKNVQTKHSSGEQYPEELRKFALTLSFYSSKAYNYVRKTFSQTLPSPTT